VVRFPDGTPVPHSPHADHAPRLNRLACGLDRGKMTGLEFGPLDRPLFGKENWNVEYVDHASREDLIAKYGGDRADQLDTAFIVNTDIVWPGGSLIERIPSGRRYDFAVASHVIEHVPDMLSWLESIAAALKPGGLINLAVPDRDQTFDHFRDLTSVAEIVDDYVRKIARPCPRHIFDHVCFASPLGMDRQYNPDLAIRTVLEAESRQAYVDVHCRVFTNASFLEVFRVLADAGLLKLECSAFFPTAQGFNEFIVSLRKAENSSPTQIASTYAGAIQALPQKQA
jgi:SAM-dependent methyltransferase